MRLHRQRQGQLPRALGEGLPEQRGGAAEGCPGGPAQGGEGEGRAYRGGDSGRRARDGELLPGRGPALADEPDVPAGFPQAVCMLIIAAIMCTLYNCTYFL